MNSIILLNAFADKKIKSLGNKALIEISHKKHLIDHHLYIFNKIYSHPEIVIVSGFDSKRLHKYLIANNLFSKKYTLKYIEHEPKESWNIGKSISEGMRNISGNSILMVNSSVIIENDTIDLIKSHKESFVLCGSNQTDDIGCIIDSTDKKVIQCFYGLPNRMYDVLYLNKKDTAYFHKYLMNNNLDKLYLFEIVNMCIEHGMIIKALRVSKKGIGILDNTKLKIC